MHTQPLTNGSVVQPQNIDKDGNHASSFQANGSATLATLGTKSYIKASGKIRIIAIGAGASMISFAREVSEGRIENADLQVFEKNSGVGGTWFENRYPGCACDIPSHVYQYSWSPNPDWSHFYSGWDEIRQYFNDVADKVGLKKYTRFNHEVVFAQWHEEGANWEVKVKQKRTGEIFTTFGDVLVNGGGIINNWTWPNINGLHGFKGELMHSAAWNPDYDFKGKKVVVIGNGSSGVQIVAALGKVVSHMTVVMRSPTWITPGFASRFAGPDGGNFKYSEEQKREFRQNPQKHFEYCKMLEEEINSRFPLMLRGTEMQEQAKAYSRKLMETALSSKKELLDKLVPTFDAGCRRLTPGDGFLEVLAQGNVGISFGDLRMITEKGIITHDGQTIEADAIICATGFDLSFKPRFPIIGRYGIDLRNQWAVDAKAYMSLAVPNFPNYLVYLGPATTAAQGSILSTIEKLTPYLVKIIRKLQCESYNSFDPFERCVHELYEKHQEFISHSVWVSHCRSTYKNGSASGKVNLIHGGSRLHHADMLNEPRWEDYQWTVRKGCSRYGYFGNGFSKDEKAGHDLASYFLCKM